MNYVRKLAVTAVFVSMLAITATAATFTVTKVADTNDGTCDSDCSLREAVGAANASAEDDTIVFSELFNDPQTITLSGTEIMIMSNGSLTINGPGAHLLTISGNNASRIISTNLNVVAAIDGITFTQGNGVGALNSGRAGAIYNVGGTLVLTNLVITGNSASNGGALNNSATGSPSVPANLTIRNCIVSNNTASGSGGSMQNFSTSTLTIENSTFTGNTSNGTTGGGAGQLNGFVRITNSTFSGNAAPNGSGGALQSNGSLLLLTNVTISGNSSANNGGGLHRGTSNVNGYLRNTIIAGNNGSAASPDVTNTAGGIQSQGHNIIGVVGTSTGWVASDQLNTDPLLSPLGFYGGFGLTYHPLTGSPAINTGDNCVLDLTCPAQNPPSAVTTDQRGATRPVSTTVDVGAVEVSPTYTAILPPASVGQPYSFTIVPAANGMTFSVSSGTPPAGITLTSDASSAVLSGTPSQTGTFNFVISNGANTLSVNYQLAVTGAATAATVSGAVYTSPGQGNPNAFVVISNGGGVVASARVNPFGRFTFNSIPFGNYTVSVISKEYGYPDQQISVSGDVTGLTFLPGPSVGIKSK